MESGMEATAFPEVYVEVAKVPACTVGQMEGKCPYPDPEVAKEATVHRERRLECS